MYFNLKIDVVPKASRAVVIRRFSLNEVPLGLFKFISDYLPYFEKINIFFNIITKKFELIYKDWSKLFVRFIRNNPAQSGCTHPCVCGLHGVYNLIEVISSWTEQKLRSILKKILAGVRMVAPNKKKKCLWRPCLLTIRNEISNLNRGPSIYASTKFRFIWLSGFRGEDFFSNYTLYKNAGFWLVNSCDIFFFTNSGLALWICRIFTSCRCICIRFNFFSWYLQNRFYPSPRRL
jgi:hypothetical protein